MKKQTKIKIAAVAAGLAISTLFGTMVLIKHNNPAQWAMATICLLSFAVSVFVGVSIED